MADSESWGSPVLHGEKQNNNHAQHPLSDEQVRTGQFGFTLIEVMIVVSIVGILAATASATYQRYIIRGQVAEGLSLSSGAKTAVSDFYMNQGVWPADNTIAGLANEAEISGTYTAQVEVKDNVIEILYGPGAHAAISGELLVLIAFDNSGSVSWSCASAGAIKDIYLPNVCR